jgi:hypothetical protein
LPTSATPVVNVLHIAMVYEARCLKAVKRGLMRLDN